MDDQATGQSKQRLKPLGGAIVARQRRIGIKDRRHQRFDVPGVFGNLRTSVTVEIMDISAGGMRVATSQYLAVGRSYALTLQHDDDRFPISARVKWCTLAGAQKVTDEDFKSKYIAGIAFEDLPAERKDALLRFLESNIELELESEISGQLQVSDSNSAIADLDFDILVRKISLSGMLIESDFAPLLDATFEINLRLCDAVFKANGRAAYVKKSALNSRFTELGVEFIDLDETQKTTLREFLDREFTTQDRTLD